MFYLMTNNSSDISSDIAKHLLPVLHFLDCSQQRPSVFIESMILNKIIRLSVFYLTNRFFVAVRLFSNRSDDVKMW